MKYCPECRAEYLDRAVNCSDCGVQLVDAAELDGASPSQGEPGAPLCAVQDPIEANLLVDLLAAEGIDARFHANAETVHIGFAEDHAGWGEIWVPRSGLRRARQLLGAFRASQREDSSEEV